MSCKGCMHGSAKETIPTIRYYSAVIREAIALLRTHPEAQYNEPLTLEELRGMDGQPVYLPGGKCWALVGRNDICPVFVWKGGECAASDWYEQVGPAYRHPPTAELKED